MEVTGKIKVLSETQTFGSGFKKREVVITTSEQYPQPILVEFVQDKIDLLDKFKVGQDVKVSINLRGREWTNPQGEIKYFNSIVGWRIESVQSTPGNLSEHVPPTPPIDAFDTTTDLNENEPDDLPF